MHKVYKPNNNKAEYDFAEMCPVCASYILVQIDYNSKKYSKRCPVCGYDMMLCTLCKWDQECEEGFSGDYKCDWCVESGCYRRKNKQRLNIGV